MARTVAAWRGDARLGAAASSLNRDGVKNPRTLGPWSPGTIASILRTADRLDRVGVAG